ncbi:hypothetical protein BKA93DRAFT_824562 [Sparassis latifolia]
MRGFHSTVRQLLNWTYKGTSARYRTIEQNVEIAVSTIPKFHDLIVTAEVQGDMHTSAKDPEKRITAKLLDGLGKAVVSIHSYANGAVIFSRASFNEEARKYGVSGIPDDENAGTGAGGSQ